MRHIHLAACGAAACLTLGAAGCAAGGLATPATVPSLPSPIPPSAPPAPVGSTPPPAGRVSSAPTAVTPAAVGTRGRLADAAASAGTRTVASAPAPTGASLPPSGHVTAAGVRLGAGPWTQVGSSPGVESVGLDYLLDADVFVHLPTVEDLARNVSWTLGADDVPVLEGYLRGVVARAAGDGLPLVARAVLSPQVLGDERTATTALVADCWDTAGGGHLGVLVAVEAVDGRWTMTGWEPREDMCWLV